MTNNRPPFAMMVLLALVVIIWFSSSAFAQVNQCYPAQQLMDRLHDTFNEKAVFKGIGRLGHVTVITLDKDTERWTAYVIRPELPPMACIVDFGSSGSTEEKLGVGS
ncbi:MAG TPA: hypothetical protein DCW74_14365 [Alteromonas australica]|uniref:Uncharacterized protein n=1 Tax=Alteromonas australica TaxID=589873 RepID=A0A350P6I6_9ALTE|nr:hypothetical protein [Alteromonas australica]|tara:strand:- start:2120 stop:2440 length:321 start_codon:yes stop_codon:yes gene_type:complete